MSVDKKWDELYTVTTLPGAGFLALLDLTQITDEQNQIITSLNAKIYFQETIVTTVDAQSNIINALGTISFSDVNTSLTQSVNDLLYDVDVGGTSSSCNSVRPRKLNACSFRRLLATIRGASSACLARAPASAAHPRPRTDTCPTAPSR